MTLEQLKQLKSAKLAEAQRITQQLAAFKPSPAVVEKARAVGRELAAINKQLKAVHN